ncbi:hypothetical protein BJX62DRAFT_199325 [Aspergillus germanicus]
MFLPLITLFLHTIGSVSGQTVTTVCSTTVLVTTGSPAVESYFVFPCPETISASTSSSTTTSTTNIGINPTDTLIRDPDALSSLPTDEITPTPDPDSNTSLISASPTNPVSPGETGSPDSSDFFTDSETESTTDSNSTTDESPNSDSPVDPAPTTLTSYTSTTPKTQESSTPRDSDHTSGNIPVPTDEGRPQTASASSDTTSDPLEEQATPTSGAVALYSRNNALSLPSLVILASALLLLVSSWD